MTKFEEENIQSGKESSLRPVAFIAVVFSTFAVTACLMTFPLVFNYVQALQASIQGEVDFCQVIITSGSRYTKSAFGDC